MPHIAPAEFLSRLEALFASCATEHSLYLTSKRLSKGAEASSLDAMSTDEGVGSHAVLFRASDGRSDGKATKFSAVVKPDSLSAFQDSLSTLLRSSLAASLKKRDKAKERRVDKMLKESRRRIEEAGGKVKVAGVGSKRGAGRRKRQRAEKKARRVRREKAKSLANTAAAGGAGSGVAEATATGRTGA